MSGLSAHKEKKKEHAARQAELASDARQACIHNRAARDASGSGAARRRCRELRAERPTEKLTCDVVLFTAETPFHSLVVSQSRPSVVAGLWRGHAISTRKSQSRPSRYMHRHLSHDTPHRQASGRPSPRADAPSNTTPAERIPVSLYTTLHFLEAPAEGSSLTRNGALRAPS